MREEREEEKEEEQPLGMEVTSELEQLNKVYVQYLDKDPGLDRCDTAEIVVELLNRIQRSLDKIVNAGETAREKLFWALYNGTIQIVSYCRTLREASHSQKVIEHLAYAMSLLDGNLILIKAKYLQWRVRVYAELAGAYEDIGAAVAAKNVVAYGKQQVEYLRELEEQDPPVPESTDVAIMEALRVLNALELKYSLQSGQLKPDAWKKKLQEYYAEDRQGLALAVVESLTTSVRKASAIIGSKKGDVPAWKPEAVAMAVDMLEEDVGTVTKALQEQIEQKERERTKQEEIDTAVEAAAKAAEEAAKAAMEEKTEEKKESKKEAKKAGKERGKKEEDKDRVPTVDEIVEKYKEMDSKMIKEKVWKEASSNVPFEVHVELIKLCFQAELRDKLDKLIESAYIRLKYRRVEVPYVTGVDILASIQRDPIIPNGYDLLPGDLNSLHLKQELTKLRASQQSMMMKTEVRKDGKGDKRKEEKKKPEEKKKEEKKKEEKKKGKTGKKEEKAPPKKKEEKQEFALESELAQIRHTYVRLIVERSRNPMNAVCGLAVSFADPQAGVPTQGKEVPVVIPLSGEDEDQIPSRLPFIVFKRTSNALKDEDEQLSLITDVKCIISRDPFMLPPVGYDKIPVDLRENPRELIGLGNREYIFIAYKTEREFRMAERDIEIVKNLLEVERSYVEKTTEAFKKLAKAQRELSLSYDQEMLSLLGSILRDAIMGPIGDMYLIDRQDMLFDIVSFLWRKYLEPVLKAIDYMEELEAHGELLDYFSSDIKGLSSDTTRSMLTSVLAVHRILNKLKMIDPVLYSEVTLQAGELCEKLMDFRTSIQVLRSGVSKVVEFREGLMKIGADSKENCISPMYITCNNHVIDSIEAQMNGALQEWTDKVLREERQRSRKTEHKPLLEADEADHEFLEIKRATKEEKKVEDEQGQLAGEIQRHRKRYYSDLEGLLAALHCDMVVSLCRAELKLGRQMEGVRNVTTKVFKEQGIEAPDMTKGVSSGLKAKMTIGRGATSKKIKTDQKYLEGTLHEAGKLPPPKPPLQSYEVILLKEANKNPYVNAIVNTQLAVHKLSYPEQQYLLLEALKWANASEEMETALSKLMVENAVYVEAARTIHSFHEKSLIETYPFNFLRTYVGKSKCPQKPVLVTRSSTSVSMMLPFFRSAVTGLPQAKSMALYGKVSVSGVGVSLNNTDYEGTGEKMPFGSVVTVPGLLPHEKFVFGAAAFTADGECPHGIGETSSEIVTLIPVSLFQIYSYLADVAYKLQAYDIAREAAERICTKVIEKNELRCNLLDSRINPILAFHLNKEYVDLLSLADVRHIANAFLVLGKSLTHLRDKRLAQAEAKGILPSLVRLDGQKAALKVCSYLVLGIEAASRVKDYYLLKLLVIQIYNTLVDFFQTETQSPLLLHALVKCHVAVTLIPTNSFDGAMRAVASCISYQIAIASIQAKEAGLLATVVRNDLSVMRRRWLTRTSRKIVPPHPLTAEEEKKKAEQDKKLAEGVDIPAAELVRVPEPTEQTFVTLYEAEREGEAIDEFFLTLGEHNDRVAMNASKWKAILKEYVEVATDGDKEISGITATIDAIVQFWKNVGANQATALDTLLKEGRKTNPRYLEFCCKVLRRMVEIDGWSETNDLINEIGKVDVEEELRREVETSLEEQSTQLNNDVLERAVKRLQILEQVCESGKEQAKETIREKVLKSLSRAQTIAAGDSAGVEEHLASPRGEPNKKEQMKWAAELLYLKGSSQFAKYKKQFGVGFCKGHANYFDVKQLDFERIKLLLEDDDSKLSKTEVGDREKLLKDMVETHAKGAVYALKSGSIILLHNLIVQLWNILLFVQASPSLHKKLGSWTHIVIISYCVVGIIGSESGGGKKVRFQEANGGAKEKKSTIVYANLISYAVQSMLMVEKWQSLADLCQRFNARTQNEYGSYLLPFAIYAQSVLYSRSEQNTLGKQSELKARVEAFEKWSLTKKKKSRAAMITGEIPPEEQEFLKDKARLSAEIMKLELIQEFCEEDKRKNEELLGLIKRDSNTAREALSNCRKGLVDYAQKTCEMLAEERIKGETSGEVRRLRKVHQMITNKIVGSYKKTIEILRERQENFMLIQALHELGNICFAEKMLKEAEVNWSDSLDTVFQELYSINNFKALCKRVPNLVAKFGMKQCLNALVLISKLHKFAYGGDLHKLSQAVEMALYICFEPFKLAMPHPQQFTLFSLYKCTELLPSINLFDNGYELNGADLLQALDYLTTLSLDYEEYERGLPALALMQFVARKTCCSNDYLVRGRTKLCISLAQIGNLQEAITAYQTLVTRKDLVEIGTRTSTFAEASKGLHSEKFDHMFNNGLSPFEEPNKSTLAELLNSDLDKSLFSSSQISELLINYLRYAKCVILFRAFETECVTGASAVERQDERVRAFRRIEDELKETLRALSKLEEIAYKKHEIEREESKLETDAKPSEELQEKKRILERLQEDEGMNIAVSGEKEYVDVRNDLITLIVHCRILIAKVSFSQGLLMDCYNTLTTTVLNMRRYCLGLSKVEGGFDFKSDIALIPEGIIAGVGLAAAVGKDKKVPAKEEKKKAAKKKEEKEVPRESEEKLEADRKEAEVKAAEENETLKTRGHINSYLWLRVKLELLNVLYFQGRHDDCEVLIRNVLEECDLVKDVYYRRLVNQYRCYICILKGKYEEGEKLFNEVVKHAKQYGQADSRYAIFLGNMGEFVFKQQLEGKAVLEYFKEGRIIMWQQLKNYGLEIEPIDINKGAYRNGVFINQDGQFKEDAYYQAGEKVVTEIARGPQEDVFDYSKEVALKLKYPEKDKNSSYALPNQYLRLMDQLIKFDTRYARAVIADGNCETAIRVLNDTYSLTKRAVNIAPAQVISVLELSAISNKQLFKGCIAQFESAYLAKAKTNKKYDAFARALPHGKELSLGSIIYSLPMFWHKVNTEYWKFIQKAYEDIKECARLISEESVVLFDFDEKLQASRAFFEYADICRLMSEYCPRPNYLFLDHSKYRKEKLRRDGPKLSEEEIEKKCEEEMAKEQAEFELLRGNYVSEALTALEQSIKCDSMQKLLQDGYPELAQTTLIDPSRAPRDVICEVFESDYHFKKGYRELPSIEMKAKTALASADLLAYNVALANELKAFTFGREVQARRLSKLHRYLKTNLSTYAGQCCISYKPYVFATSAKDLYMPKTNTVSSMWIKETTTGKDVQLYVIGPKEGEGPAIDFGSLTVESKELGKLYQDAQQLLKAFVESSTKSASVFERDKKMARATYEEVILRVAALFAPRQVIEERKELLQKCTPEFTEKNLRDLAEHLAVYGRSIEHRELAPMLRLFHSIRYKLL